MLGRIMKREEFVVRMLANQELRKQHKRELERDAKEAIFEINLDRKAKYLRNKKYK